MGKVDKTISIDTELLRQAEEQGVSLEAALEDPLLRAVGRRPPGFAEGLAAYRADPVSAEARAKKWAEDNAEAIKDRNRLIAERGLFGDEYRKW